MKPPPLSGGGGFDVHVYFHSCVLPRIFLLGMLGRLIGKYGPLDYRFIKVFFNAYLAVKHVAATPTTTSRMCIYVKAIMKKR